MPVFPILLRFLLPVVYGPPWSHRFRSSTGFQFPLFPLRSFHHVGGNEFHSSLETLSPCVPSSSQTEFLDSFSETVQRHLFSFPSASGSFTSGPLFLIRAGEDNGVPRCIAKYFPPGASFSVYFFYFQRLMGRHCRLSLVHNT